MTPDQLTALAARLRDHAAMHESIVPNDDEQRQWRDDLLDAAEYLRQCAQAEPVAWHYATIAGTRITHYADRLDVAQLAHDMKAAREYPNAHKVTPLYTHPQPQQGGVPDGWRLVPERPTPEMLVAINWPNDPAGYRAMLAAAPQPPSAPAGLRVTKDADSSVWLHVDAPSGKKASICLDALAVQRGGIVGAALLEWIDSFGSIPQPPSAQADALAVPQTPSVQIARTLAEWHEDCGPVVWWRFQVDEPAWIGTPLDADWPGYHTHWTPHPSAPEEPTT